MKIIRILLLSILVMACSHPENDNKKPKNKKKKYVVKQEEPYFINEDFSQDYPTYEHTEYIATATPTTEENTSSHQTILKMEHRNGVKYVWIEINDVRLKFIFDTGASDIFISPAEAMVLVKQGTLDEDDFLGFQNYQDASGRISEGVIVNLKKVKLGNKILRNVKASISDNESTPLLLGQSALERFGKIEIDNVNQQIILKD